MDPISNMFSQMSNAIMGKKAEIATRSSNFKKAILEVLKKEGCIDSFIEEKKINDKFLKIKLKYSENQPTIKHIRRISKPSLRVYKTSALTPRPRQGFGLILISTNKGILTGYDAKKRKIGGEIICEILY